MRDFLLRQPPRGRQHLHQLIGADGRQNESSLLTPVTGPIEPDTAVLHELAGLIRREHIGDDLRFRHDEGPDLAVCLIELFHHGGGAVEIGGKEHARDVGRLAEHRFRHAGILMGLLVLPVLPGVRGEDERHREPPLRTARLQTMVGENDLLPDRAVHLAPERFIGVHQVDPALVGQCGGHYRFFIQRRDDGAIDGFRHGRLGIGHTELEPSQRGDQPVRQHLIGIADPRAQPGIGLQDGDEHAIDRGHR